MIGFNGTSAQDVYVSTSIVTEADQRGQSPGHSWDRSGFSKETDSKVSQKDNNLAALPKHKQYTAFAVFACSKMNQRKTSWVQDYTSGKPGFPINSIDTYWGIKFHKNTEIKEGNH